MSEKCNGFPVVRTSPMHRMIEAHKGPVRLDLRLLQGFIERQHRSAEDVGTIQRSIHSAVGMGGETGAELLPS